jgi:hypothetical protein
MSSTIFNSKTWFFEFSMKPSFNIQKTSTLQVQMPLNQDDAPLLLESFPKRQRTQSEAS